MQSCGSSHHWGFEQSLIQLELSPPKPRNIVHQARVHSLALRDRGWPINGVHGGERLGHACWRSQFSSYTQHCNNSCFETQINWFIGIRSHERDAARDRTTDSTLDVSTSYQSDHNDHHLHPISCTDHWAEPCYLFSELHRFSTCLHQIRYRRMIKKFEISTMSVRCL